MECDKCDTYSESGCMRPSCPARVLITLWELVPAAASAMVMSLYAKKNEKITLFRDDVAGTSEIQASMAYIERLLDPGPATMLVACLVFGCSISSYSYRRQDRDRYQTQLFVLAIGMSVVVGAFSGRSVNMILLSFIPWALCMAMVISAAIHFVMRHCGIKTTTSSSQDEENRPLLA